MCDAFDLLIEPLNMSDQRSLSFIQLFFCHLFCLSVCEQDYCKSNHPISLKFCVMFEPTSMKNWLTFGGDSVPDHFSTCLAIAEYGILGGLLAFLVQSPASFHDTRRND